MEKVRDNIVSRTGECRVTSKYVATGKSGPTHVSSGTICNGESHKIVYDGSKRTGPIKKTRFCDHTVVKRVHSCPHVWKYTNAGMEWTYNGHPGWDYAPPSVVDALSSIDLSNCHSDALDFFKAGCTDQELDLSANLFEFKQIFHTFSFLKGKIKGLSDLIKRGANAHLSYSFGIEPLVKDAVSLYESLTSLEKKVAWLRKSQGKVIPVRYKTDVTDLIPECGKTHTQSKEHTLYRKQRGFSGEYKAYALVQYDVSSLSDLELKLRTVTRALGLDNPLSTAWELLPFSFLVDWVFSVGDFIGQLAPKISLPIRFIDQGWSIEIMWDYEDIIRFNQVSGAGLPWTFNKARVEFYHREPGIPVSLGSIALTGDLSLRKLALGMSLAIQRV